MTLLTPGPIRLAVLAGVESVTKTKTLYLPAPAAKSVELEWIEKQVEQELVDGSERTRVLGYLPVLKCKWTPYDDKTKGTMVGNPANISAGATIGNADGQRPTLEQLLVILSSAPGTLKVSLGDGVGNGTNTKTTPLGFVVGRVTVGGSALRGLDMGDLTVTFRGRTVSADRSLGAF